MSSERCKSPDIFLDSKISMNEDSEGISESINSIDLNNYEVSGELGFNKGEVKSRSEGNLQKEIETFNAVLEGDDTEEDNNIEEVNSPKSEINDKDICQKNSQKRPLNIDDEDEDFPFRMSLTSDEEISKMKKCNPKLSREEKKKRRKIATQHNKRTNSTTVIPDVAKHSTDNTPRGTPYTSFYHMSPEHPGSPIVAANSHHSVMVKLPLTPDCTPSPHPSFVKDIWDAHHVRLPCSLSSLYPRPTNNGSELCSRWEVICSALLQPMNSVAELQEVILKYNTRYIGKWEFHGLKKLIHQEFTEEEQKFFFTSTLPKIRDLALKLPQVVTTPPPLLQANREHSVTLSQLQIASLLANAFFCTFPRRNAKGFDTEYGKYPDINFNRFFFHSDDHCIAKIKCILNYFRIVTKKEPSGLLTLTRRKIDTMRSIDWQRCSDNLPRIYCHHTGFIEEFENLLQADFANKYLGGGVLGKGCVQEEIRFVLCPELLISRLLTEELKKDEALIFIGVEQYNTGTGYSRAFSWTGSHTDTTEKDCFGRRLCQLVAIDALHFTTKRLAQYEEKQILRELNKALAGFLPLEGSRGRPVAVATGNWGCGAFKGDPKLKALIQAAACGYSKRDLVYLTFSDETLKNSIADIYQFLQSKNVTVGQLTQCLFQYSQLNRKVDGNDLYKFIECSFNSTANSDDSDDENSSLVPSNLDNENGKLAGGANSNPHSEPGPSYKTSKNYSTSKLASKTISKNNKKITDFFTSERKDNLNGNNSKNSGINSKNRKTNSKNNPGLSNDEVTSLIMEIDENEKDDE